MAYRVRNADGELLFPNLLELERAYVQGLVEDDDDVQETGHTTWRKAGSFPVLVRARQSHRGQPLGDQVIWALGAIILAILTFYWLLKADWAKAVPAALLVCAVLFRVSSRAFKKPKSTR